MGTRRRPGWSFALVLGTPTMWWIILSGALHNFIMYALGAWLAPYLIRFHGADDRAGGRAAHRSPTASRAAPACCSGGRGRGRHAEPPAGGRLLLGAACLALSVPLLYAALQVPAGRLVAFALRAGRSPWR